MPWDDNQVVDLRMLCQIIHAMFNQRGRSTTTSGEELINAILILISNIAGMGITSLPTLQRMATFAFPSLVGKEFLPELLEFKSTTARMLLPALLRISHDAADIIMTTFNHHQEQLRRVHDMNRQVVLLLLQATTNSCMVDSGQHWHAVRQTLAQPMQCQPHAGACCTV